MVIDNDIATSESSEHMLSFGEWERDANRWLFKYSVRDDLWYEIHVITALSDFGGYDILDADAELHKCSIQRDRRFDNKTVFSRRMVAENTVRGCITLAATDYAQTGDALL